MNLPTRSLLLFLCLTAALPAREIVVDQNSPAADDAGPGTGTAPFKTLARASAEAQPGDTVLVHDGVYREILSPSRSGREGSPITFQAAGDSVWVKGSDVVSGWVRDGSFWVKRPWRPRHAYDAKTMDKVSAARFFASARQDQVFVQGKPLQWYPDRDGVGEGGFWWAPDGAELALRLPDGVDPNAIPVEVPVRPSVVAAWPKIDLPRNFHEAEAQRQAHPDRVPAEAQPADWIVIRGFKFAHNAATLNRAGVRIQGRHWLFEDNRVEWMNAVGVQPDDDSVVRNNTVCYNGQDGFGVFGGAANVLLEDNRSLWDNQRGFSTTWGGAGDKFCGTQNLVIRRHVVLGEEGPGLWFDVDCYGTTVEDCVLLPNRQDGAGALKTGSNGAIFYEISYGGTFRNNVLFGNHNRGQASVYGGGLTFSSSTHVAAQDNTVLFCDDAIGVPGGPRKSGGPGRYWAQEGLDAYYAKDVAVSGTLVAGDLCTALFTREPSVIDPKMGNRFIGTTVIASQSGARAVWGGKPFPTLTALDAASGGLVSGSSVFPRLEDAPGAARERLDAAARRLLDALGAIDPKLVRSGPLHVEAIWSFPEKSAHGLLVATGEERLLLLDRPAETEIAFAPGAGASPRLWADGSESPLALSDGRAVVRGAGFAVVTGLGAGSRPASSARLEAEQDGRPVSRLLGGHPAVLVAEVSNPSTEPATVRIEGAGFHVSGVSLAPGETRRFRAPEFSPAPGVLHQQASAAIGGAAAQTLALDLPVAAPAVAPPLASSFDLSRPAEGPAALVLGSEAQVAPGIYDLATGIGWRGADDLSAEGRLGWSPEVLRVRVDVRDDRVVPLPGKAPWEGDCVELFLDTRSGAPNAAFRLAVAAPATKDDAPLALSGGFPTGTKAVGRQTSQGYVVAIEIPAAGLPGLSLAAGASLGLDMAIDDCDDPKAGRHTQMFWSGTPDDATETDGFGTVVLGDGP